MKGKKKKKKKSRKVSGDNMCNIRPIICHLACGRKVKNIQGLIYAKICRVLKVLQENMIQDAIIYKNNLIFLLNRNGNFLFFPSFFLPL
uniref:Uncharacterized protein n=1 Tax=Corvus moneduloides TaxID=1196302 RepID=A0A8C3DXV7_CORMO